MSPLLSDGARWLVMAIFALSLGERITLLRSKSSRWHPVMLAYPLLRRHAPLWTALALVADAMVLGLMVISPSSGAPMAIALVVAYSLLALHARPGPEGHCRCFWKVLNTATRLALLVRNSVVIGLAVLVVAQPPRLSVSGLALGAIFMVCLMAITRLTDQSPQLTHAPDGPEQLTHEELEASAALVSGGRAVSHEGGRANRNGQ